MPVALVVEYDASARDRLVGWLRDAGFAVTTCPGPVPPDLICPAERYGRCSLAEDADIVVLDLCLYTDVMMEGTPGRQLLTYYRSIGKPVVALSGPEDTGHPIPDDGVVIVRRPVDRAPFLEAVHAVLAAVPLRRSLETRVGDLTIVRDAKVGDEIRERGATGVGIT